MAKNIETLAKKLGASIEGTVPDYSPGAFGMSALANLLRDRLEPGGRQAARTPQQPGVEQETEGADGARDGAAPQGARQPAQRR